MATARDDGQPEREITTMIIYNVTGEILQQALNATNRVFDGNIRFKRIEQMKGKTREGGEKWVVTLTVFSTWRKVPNPTPGAKPALVKVTAPGVRRAVNAWTGEDGKRMAAACWRAHGTFFDALPVRVILLGKSGSGVAGLRPAEVRIVTGRLTTHPGDPWNDFNIGSAACPTELSIACDCEDVEPKNGVRYVDAGARSWQRGVRLKRRGRGRTDDEG